MIDMIELYKRAMVVGMCVFLWWVLWATLGCAYKSVNIAAYPGTNGIIRVQYDATTDVPLRDIANGNTFPMVP